MSSDQSENKTCQNCKKDFIVEPDDFGFYEKIKVPPPTFCPECRLQRRMSWRNVWHLYKKEDAHTKKEIFSAFTSESSVKIYDKDYWMSDEWDPLKYGREIDWSKPFISQIINLLKEVPVPANPVQSVVNSEYCTNASYIKNCYFSRALVGTEDCAYVIQDVGSIQCMDSHMTDHCEFSYGNVNCTNCYKTFFSVNCKACHDVTLSKDCVGCSDCVGCVGLRNKSYYIFNVPYTKEEYISKLLELNLGSKKQFKKCEKLAKNLWLEFPVKFMQGVQNVNVLGDYLYNSKNAKYCWRSKGVEDSKYCINMFLGPVKDCYDYANFGGGSELIYESLVCGDQTSNIKFSLNCFGGAKNIEYSIFCQGASNLFGCISARRKQYCILNKQYSKQEYEELVPKIIKHMKDVPYVDKRGIIYKYGEFFPAELSFIPFNVSEAYELSPMDKKTAIESGFNWVEEPVREYTITKNTDDLPDMIKEVKEDILNEVIACEHKEKCFEECTGAFRIVSRELNFLKRFNLPLPSLCPNCRHYGRLAMRNLPRFFKRVCQCAGTESENGIYKNSVVHSHGKNKCMEDFDTSYSPDRPEIVYCEKCYQQEVY